MVECGGLENRCRFAPTQGSNPCLSATLYQNQCFISIGWMIGGQRGIPISIPILPNWFLLGSNLPSRQPSRHRLQPDILHDRDDRLHIRLGEHAGDALIAEIGVGALVEPRRVDDAPLGQVIDHQVEELGLVAVQGPALGQSAERLLGGSAGASPTGPQLAQTAHPSPLLIFTQN